MKFHWPRRAPDLPPGQRLLETMPRFSDAPHKLPPTMPDDPSLVITNDGEAMAQVSATQFRAIGPRNFRASFHCVTTWSVVDLSWTGVPLVEVLASVGITEPPAPYLRLLSGDRRKASFLWEDAIADDVLLATHLNGQPLGDRHGGPLRLVAPAHYGYKNVKHLVGIDFRAKQPRLASKEHLRGRVWEEERHPSLPNWAVRVPYRLLIPPTAFIAERTLARHKVAQ